MLCEVRIQRGARGCGFGRSHELASTTSADDDRFGNPFGRSTSSQLHMPNRQSQHERKGDTVKLDPRGSTVLGEDACRSRLAREATANGIGRVAINGDRSPYVIPVNFTVVEGGIVIRLGTGWAAFHLDGAAVTFETDQAMASRHSGWSVVVEGVARIVPYDDVARLGANLPTPIVSVPGVRVFEIVPYKVSGSRGRTRPSR